MAKCGVVNCTEKVVGGFESTIDAGHFQSSTATIPGLLTYWCKDHEEGLNQDLGQGHYLSEQELK
jgi:hypothetical protein